MATIRVATAVGCLGLLAASPPLDHDRDNVVKTGWMYSRSFLQHEAGEHHPENPERLKAVMAGLEESEVFNALVEIRPAPASLRWLRSIHTVEYINRVRQACRQRESFLDSRDTGISRQSFEVARLATGGVLAAVDEVVAEKVNNAFCAVRPPGHHARADKAMGFCLFNHVAIATRYLQLKHGLDRILIVDWDVHHGNGTEAAFYEDPGVMFFSVHQHPFYPGTGTAERQGKGEGLGYNVNVPLPAGSGDEQYLKAFAEILKPRALQFDPDFVIISAGFDAHEDDPLGNMRVTTEGFVQMTRIVNEIAKACCKGRLVSVLEGGYDPKALAESVIGHVSALRE